MTSRSLERFKNPTQKITWDKGLFKDFQTKRVTLLGFFKTTNSTEHLSPLVSTLSNPGASQYDSKRLHSITLESVRSTANSKQSVTLNKT